MPQPPPLTASLKMLSNTSLARSLHHIAARRLLFAAYSQTSIPIEGNLHHETFADCARVSEPCGLGTPSNRGTSRHARGAKGPLAYLLFNPTHVVCQLRVDSSTRSSASGSHLGAVRNACFDWHYLDHDDDCRIRYHHDDHSTIDYVDNVAPYITHVAGSDRLPRLLD